MLPDQSLVSSALSCFFCSFLRVDREAVLEMTIWPMLIRVMAVDFVCIPVVHPSSRVTGRDREETWLGFGWTGATRLEKSVKWPWIGAVSRLPPLAPQTFALCSDVWLGPASSSSSYWLLHQASGSRITQLPALSHPPPGSQVPPAASSEPEPPQSLTVKHWTSTV